MTKYDLEYKGVTCIGADWETDQFLLIYNGCQYLYVQKRYISQSADTDHIRCVIDQFLEDVQSQNNSFASALAYLQEHFEKLGDITLDPNLGNCKRCVNRMSCGNKNKVEASWCHKYRPEIKKKRKKGRKKK